MGSAVLRVVGPAPRRGRQREAPQQLDDDLARLRRSPSLNRNVLAPLGITDVEVGSTFLGERLPGRG
jgi:hypothetical protein